MKGRTRILALALVLVLVLMIGCAAPAGAEVMTLGVYFRGVAEREDGTAVEIPLAGSFRVLQGGMDRGVIQAGETTVTLKGSEPASLVPMPETIEPGWDLSQARVTVNLTRTGNMTVPILAKRADGSGAGTPAAAEPEGGTDEAPEDAEPEDETDEASEGAEPEDGADEAPEGAEPGDGTDEAPEGAEPEDGTDEAPEGTEPEDGAEEVPEGAEPEDGDTPEEDWTLSGSEDPAETAADRQRASSGPTPEWLPTPVPSDAPTPEPEVGMLSGSADTGTFRIKVFYDSNNNGGCSVYEKGVAGVQVYIVSEAGEIVTGGKTDGEGLIDLPGLQPGSYRVRVSLEEKWGFNRRSKNTGLDCSIMTFSAEGIQDSEPIRVSAGETVERGVGLLRGVVVDGVCWMDENSDGIMNDSEPRMPGVRVTLTGQKNGLTFEAYSDENGYWRVIRVRAGFYDFTGYAPEGMAFTRYTKTGGKKRSVFTAEGRTKSTRTLDLNDGKDTPDQNIGFIREGTVSGIAFLDENYNGLFDEGEKPLAGVKVTAIKQLKDEEVAVAFSGEDGRYTLSGLRGNTYSIRAVLPDDGCNFTRTVDEPEGNHFEARSGRRENFWRDFVLKDGEGRTANVGAVYYGSVSGTVYLDDDFSATRNGKEKAASGISVVLVDENGAEADRKQTSAKGTYSFTGLTPGKYSLRMTAKKGYAFTRLGEGSVMLNLNNGEGYSEPFDVSLGESITGKDAGMIKPATVQGAVFADADDNGRRDSGEAGLAGTVVRLMSEEGEAFSAKLTDSGEFLFDAVMPGRYYLEYRLPAGAVFAQTGRDNTITGEDGVGRGEWFDIAAAGSRKAPLCGGLILGSISGITFLDHDGSGSREAGDSPLEGVRITLTPTRSDLQETAAVSDAKGAFALTELHPDTYRLKLTLPEGLVTARTSGLAVPLKAGLREQEVKVTVAMGQNRKKQAIGASVPGTLRGRIWMDENNNGLMEEGEQTPAGLTMLVTDEKTGEVFRALKTGADGMYSFDGMVPGSYTLVYEADADTDLPPEGDSTFTRDGSRLVMTGVALEEGESRDDPVLGFVKTTSMGGEAWIDRGNGAVPLAEAVIRLLDEEGNVLQTQTTPETGMWRFYGLMPGNYRIQAEMPEGTVAVEPDDERLEAGLTSVLQETDGRTGTSDPIPLKMGEDRLQLHVGAVLPGTIGDFCWLDLNGNGWQDGGELGIPHVRVELVRNGETVAVTETDQYGLYFFREVYPAVYTLKATAPSEVKPTQKRTDIDLIDSSLNETEEEVAWTDEFAVASDSTDFNMDLGYALRRAGDYPPGYGEQETMDWSRAYDNVTLK